MARARIRADGVMSGEPAKSVLFVPLIVGDEHGIISLQNIDRENAFSESTSGC